MARKPNGKLKILYVKDIFERELKEGQSVTMRELLERLIARGYTAIEAAALAVWIHGYAGDALTERCTAEAYSSRDLVDALYLGFKVLAE